MKGRNTCLYSCPLAHPVMYPSVTICDLSFSDYLQGFSRRAMGAVGAVGAVMQ